MMHDYKHLLLDTLDRFIELDPQRPRVTFLIQHIDDLVQKIKESPVEKNEEWLIQFGLSLEILFNIELLTLDYFHHLAQHENPWAFAHALETLVQHKLLTPENVDMLIKRPETNAFRIILYSTALEHLLTQENINALMNYQNDIDNLAYFIESYHDMNDYNRGHQFEPFNISFNTMLQLQEPEDVTRILYMILIYGPLNCNSPTTEQQIHKNFHAIINHQNPKTLREVFAKLIWTEPFDLAEVDIQQIQENFNAVVEHHNINDRLTAINTFNEGKAPITQEHFNTLFLHKKATSLGKISTNSNSFINNLRSNTPFEVILDDVTEMRINHTP